MAIRSLFFGLKRPCHNNLGFPTLVYAKDQTPLRWFSSGALKVDSAEEASSVTSSADDLKSRIFRLRFSKRSATNALQRWVNEGKKMSLEELRQIGKELNRAQRYKHALEISEWMVTHPEFELAVHDYAVRIDLITKVFGSSSAEEFFEGLPPTAKTGETYAALLHSYASAKQIDKAEKLFEKIKDLKLTLSVLMYNELMTLYMSVGELDKIPLLVEELRSKQLSLDLFSYNLWASACAAKFDINGLRKILDEMSDDPNSNILMWIEGEARCKISAADHAMRLDLTLKVHDLHKAEEYFTNIPDISSQKAACFPLLHHYVKERNIEKAESFMSKLHALGLTATTHPFNEMMKLYIATGDFKKVPLIIKEMKHYNIPRNVLSYNLWMSAAHALSGVHYAEIIYREMMNDKNVKVGWSTHCTLANFYVKSGLSGKALDSLKAAEEKLSTKNRLGYFFLITLYTTLGNKSGVLRLWEASKKVPGRITCQHYKCVLSCLVKLDEIKEAERVFMTWESKLKHYDVRVSNVLLSAYMRMGWMEKAEMLHNQTLEKGASPNYKTWEILMEGWVKRKDMPKAVQAMKSGCLLLEECNWRPPHSLLLAILQYFEEMNSIDDAMEYVEVLHKLKLTTLPIYHSLLRLHVRAQKPPSRILEMMDKDGARGWKVS
ncbi:hypothetical protein H6P81_010724 [Aristolochia fimbriata]|uniref:Pentatricopeptide repeat-containing protein n=1 Tax=Aristolochia fimbriata TaxID=158543 RepID=A0AAV7EQR0_ARIFI|nr:hypothetical protein H6P81_010724 [Aristolochia fimbriata]